MRILEALGNLSKLLHEGSKITGLPWLGGYQMNCVNEFPSSVGMRPSKMIEKACIA